MSRLETVRHELLALHRALLDAQRIVHERDHGKVSSGAFLELVIGAPEFAWLRPLTALIVAIDEAIDTANPDSARARRLALIAAKKSALASLGGPGVVAPSAPQDAGRSVSSDDAVRDTAENIEALLVADTHKLLTLAGEAGEFQRQYATALHDAPKIALAHASVLRALALPGPRVG